MVHVMFIMGVLALLILRRRVWDPVAYLGKAQAPPRLRFLIAQGLVDFLWPATIVLGLYSLASALFYFIDVDLSTVAELRQWEEKLQRVADFVKRIKPDGVISVALMAGCLALCLLPRIAPRVAPAAALVKPFQRYFAQYHLVTARVCTVLAIATGFSFLGPWAGQKGRISAAIKRTSDQYSAFRQVLEDAAIEKVSDQMSRDLNSRARPARATRSWKELREMTESISEKARQAAKYRVDANAATPVVTREQARQQVVLKAREQAAALVPKETSPHVETVSLRKAQDLTNHAQAAVQVAKSRAAASETTVVLENFIDAAARLGGKHEYISWLRTFCADLPLADPICEIFSDAIGERVSELVKRAVNTAEAAALRTPPENPVELIAEEVQRGMKELGEDWSERANWSEAERKLTAELQTVEGSLQHLTRQVGAAVDQVKEANSALKQRLRAAWPQPAKTMDPSLSFLGDETFEEILQRIREGRLRSPLDPTTFTSHSSVMEKFIAEVETLEPLRQKGVLEGAVAAAEMPGSSAEKLARLEGVVSRELPLGASAAELALLGQRARVRSLDIPGESSGVIREGIRVPVRPEPIHIYRPPVVRPIFRR